MALEDITLNDGQAVPVAHTFAFVSSANGRVVRSDLSRPAEEPLLMTHAHSKKTVSGKVVKSHLIRIDMTALDSDGVTPYAANIRVMADVPSPILSDAVADDLAAYIRNWATSANVRAWLKDSVG